MHPPPFRPPIHKQRPHQSNSIRQRQPSRNRTHNRRQLLQRKKHPTQKHHRRHEQREVIGKKVIPLRQRIEDQRHRRKRDPAPNQHHPGHDQLGAVTDPKSQHHKQDRSHSKDRLERRPQHLRKHDVIQPHRRIHDPVPSLLHMHPRKRRIQRLEARRIHRTHADRPTRQEQDVGHLRAVHRHLSHQSAHPVAKRHEPDQRLRDVPDQARQGKLAPHQQVAQKHRPPSHRQFRRAPHRG
ncbi:hypothetical protein FQZ97_715130 [compost metagenome]